MKFFLWLSCILNLVLVGYLINRPVQYIQTDYNFIHRMDTLQGKYESNDSEVRTTVNGFPVPLIIGPPVKEGRSIKIPIQYDTTHTWIKYFDRTRVYVTGGKAVQVEE